jgi:twinkle protein
MIVPHEQIRDEVLAVYRAGGLPKGSTTGWPSLDKHYTVGLAQWTLITGHPGSGKSEFLDAMLVNLAKAGDWRFYIYSPENWPLTLHHAKIIEKYIGKPFDPGPTPRMDEEDIEAAEAWMEDKFFFCKPNSPTILSILAEAELHVPDRKAGDSWKLGVIVDPWNQLEHHRPSNMTETEYVSKTLTDVIDHVRTWNMHLWLVAHPAKMRRLDDGKLPVPTPHDVAGSAHFWNKSDNCLTVWRDQQEGSQDVQIYVQKVRFKNIGRIGKIDLRYDRVTGRYFEPLVRIQNTYSTKDD